MKKELSEKGKKLSAALKGIPKSPEARERMRIATAKRYSDPDFRKKMGDLQRDRVKGIPKTEEHKAKISAAHKGKIVSDETRAKMSAARKGMTYKKKSKETNVSHDE